MRAPELEGDGFVKSISLDLAEDVDVTSYPFSLPIIAALDRVGELALNPAVTFLVGDNGTGKSTLAEAVAVALGFNAEGGSKNFRFATNPTHSDLWDYIRISRTVHKPRDGFFLRAESFYNVATEIERLNDDPGSAPLLPAYGGRSLHQRSHGESFLDLAVHRFGPRGLYVLDEPEAALSVRGQLALLARMRDLVEQGSQFIVATHSPILTALPEAWIVQIDDTGLHTVAYDEADHVQLTRTFMENPNLFLKYLFDNDDI